MKLVLTSVIALAALAVGAQSGPPPTPTVPPTSDPAATVVRTLQPEDILSIRVLRQPELSLEAPIGVDGYVSAPFVGRVYAQGKTTDALQTELTELYRDRVRLKQPIVSVSVVKYREQRATVGGFVQRPGTIPFRPGDTILSLLNQGGGPVPDRADLRRATLQRQGSAELIPIDLFALLYRGDTSQNYPVQDGDQLNVPEATQLRILVQGKIAAPGIYPYKEPMTVADAISSARGEIPGRSRLSRTIVIREKTGNPGQYIYIPVDYVRFIRKRDQTQNILLQPGDIIYIPETNTPDLPTLSGLANVAFLFNSLGGGFLGINLFGN